MSRAALPLFVLLTLAASAWLSTLRASRLVTDEALAAMEAAVRESFRAGDLVLAQPPYLGYARARLGDMPLWEPRHVTAADLSPFRTLHLLSFAGQEIPTALLDPGRVTSEQSWPGVTYTTIAPAAAYTVLFDLRRDLAQAKVSARYPDGVEAACDRFDRNRWLCPRNADWSYVGRETLEIDDQPRDCVWLHPLAQGGVLRVELPTVAAQAAQGGFGFTRSAAHRAGAPVKLRMLAGDQEIFTATHPVAWGWRHFRVPLSTDAPVSLEVTTTHNGASHFCLSLLLTEPAP